MTEAVAIAEIVIHRPIEIVRAQFLDLQHHIAKNVHPDIEIVDHQREGAAWVYTQGQHVFGRMRHNHVRLEAAEGESVRLAWLSGPDRGTVQTVTFQPLGDASTRVRSRTTIPLSGLMSLMKFLVEKQVSKLSLRALEQDRLDLEQGGYPRGGTYAEEKR
jgi:hypothetical protein